jgi:hypothetical protein
VFLFIRNSFWCWSSETRPAHNSGHHRPGRDVIRRQSTWTSKVIVYFPLKRISLFMFVYFIVTCLRVWNASGQITETSCTLTKQNTGLHLLGMHVNLQPFCPEGLNTRHFKYWKRENQSIFLEVCLVQIVGKDFKVNVY